MKVVLASPARQNHSQFLIKIQYLELQIKMIPVSGLAIALVYLR